MPPTLDSERGGGGGGGWPVNLTVCSVIRQIIKQTNSFLSVSGVYTQTVSCPYQGCTQTVSCPYQGCTHKQFVSQEEKGGGKSYRKRDRCGLVEANESCGS